MATRSKSAYDAFELQKQSLFHTDSTLWDLKERMTYLIFPVFSIIITHYFFFFYFTKVKKYLSIMRINVTFSTHNDLVFCEIFMTQDLSKWIVFIWETTGKRTLLLVVIPMILFDTVYHSEAHCCDSVLFLWSCFFS